LCCVVYVDDILLWSPKIQWIEGTTQESPRHMNFTTRGLRTPLRVFLGSAHREKINRNGSIKTDFMSDSKKKRIHSQTFVFVPESWTILLGPKRDGHPSSRLSHGLRTSSEKFSNACFEATVEAAVRLAWGI
jgi:hypothetical protein